MITPQSIREMLATRTPDRFKVAHVLETATDLWCLDLDLHAPDWDGLQAAMQDATDLVVAPDAAWLRYAAAPLLTIKVSPKTKAATRGYLVWAVIRTER